MCLGAGLLAVSVPPSSFAQSSVFAANYGSGGTVSQFSVGAAGALTQQGTGVLSGSSSSSMPGAAVVSPNGLYLYVSNFGLGTVSQFSIGAGGALTQVGTGVISGSGAGSQPFGLAVSPNGQNLYVANEGLGTVSVFSIGAGGALTQQGPGVPSETGTGSQPAAVAVSPNGQNLYVVNQGAAMGRVSAFSIGAGGAITSLGAPVTAGVNTSSQPVADVVSPNGQYLYVANAAEGTVSTFQVGPGGTIGQPGPPVSTGSGAKSDPHALALSPNGQDLYVGNFGEGTVSTFQIGAAGSITQQGTPVTSGSGAGSDPSGMAVSPGGQYLYVANYADGTVSTFPIGAGGALTAQGTPVRSGAGATSGPYALAISPDQGPTASFTATVAPPGFATQFNAQSSTAGSAPIGTYAWQFGDGGAASGALAGHTFLKPGAYTVKLTLTGGDFCSVIGPFTGQSSSCAPDPAASAVKTITVPASPNASNGSITGIAKRRPRLAFTVAAGTGGAPLQTIAVSLPSGLRCSSAKRLLARGVTITGANGRHEKFAATVAHGVLTIALRPAAPQARVAIAAPALSAANALAKRVSPSKRGKHRKPVKLIVKLKVTDSGGHAFAYSLTLTAH